jgi:hypothetical protein
VWKKGVGWNVLCACGERRAHNTPGPVSIARVPFVHPVRCAQFVTVLSLCSALDSLCHGTDLSWHAIAHAL